MKNIPIKDKSVSIQIKKTYRTNGNVRGLLLFLLSINTGIKLVDLLKLTVADVRDNAISFFLTTLNRFNNSISWLKSVKYSL